MDEFVIECLRLCQCEKYKDIFADNEIDEEAFLSLSSNDLQILLPGKVGPQKKILLQIQKELQKLNYTKVQDPKTPESVAPSSSSSLSSSSSMGKESLLISLDDINLYKQRMLGSGHFGTVYLGEIKQTQRLVAIKFLKVETEADLNSFEYEVKIMAKAGKHKNQLELVGFSTLDHTSKQCVLITEYCELGDLHTYLRSNRDGFFDDLKNDSSTFVKRLGKLFGNLAKKNANTQIISYPYTLSSSQLLKWSMQISEGMEYLSRKNIVHADLAARNIFISNAQEAKIGDFGLSKSLYEKQYIRKESACLPWAWAAPECLRDCKFSVWSDIWSYGITLWEIFSLGQVPYGGFRWTREFESYLKSGLRLRKPNFASPEIYLLMKSCWSLGPYERISFPEISKQLEKMIADFQRKTKPHLPTLSQFNFNEIQNAACSSLHSNVGEDEISLDSENAIQLDQNSDLDTLIRWINKSDIPELSSSDLKIDISSLLGQGHIGKVYKGTVRGVSVAVKTIIKDTDKIGLRSVLTELQILSLLGDHGNIIELVGAQTAEFYTRGILHICTRYYSLGCLQEFLKYRCYLYNGRENPRISQPESAKSLVRSSSTNDGYVTFSTDTEKLDSSSSTNSNNYYNFMDLLNWSKQLATAMDYLNSWTIIHGDLATRNIFLDDAKQIKLTGFGELSRKLDYIGGQYQLEETMPVPWAWMALESLRDMTFSTCTDIWSFGVTIWEIFSLGESPYAGHSWTFDFVEKLGNGLRLEKPKLATKYLYWTIMAACWDEKPEHRPSFKTIIQKLTHITNEVQKQ